MTSLQAESGKRSLESLISDLRKWFVSGRLCSGGLTPAMFKSAGELFHAGCWCIVCVGEAAGEILADYPDFPDEDLKQKLELAKGAGLHALKNCLEMDAELVWQTVEVSFVTISNALESRIKSRQMSHEQPTVP